MNAQELRLGNYFNRGKVISIKRTSIAYENENGQTFAVEDKYAEPIRLTSEIIKSAGFERMGTFYERGDVRVYASLRNGWMLQEYYRRTVENTNIKGCAFLHQFQNLYFALTGQELELNLSTALISNNNQ